MSKLADGSSSKIILLFFASALPIASLCFSPPDKNFALNFSLSLRPIIFKILRASSFEQPVINKLSRLVKSLIKLKS